ncbi:hypothetical protein [Aquimarina rhabdastrellae]
MNLINEYISEYEKQFDFYNEIARLVHNKLEDEIISRGIKAIVTYRAKRPDRLKAKVNHRNIEKKYKDLQEIRDDIVDLAGTRVSLYFPNERKLLDEIINDLFDVQDKKDFPGNKHNPEHRKRFSGYWANHYRIFLNKDEDIPSRYFGTIVEIQVASLIMHSWSEVEHDLIYKPLSGELSEEELAILDELNGLVMTGEIALERLHRAMTIRTEKKNSIDSKYELTNFLINRLDYQKINNNNFGKTDFFNENLLQFKNLIKPSKFNNYIKNINYNNDESASDQLITLFLIDAYSNERTKKNLTTYFKDLETSKSKQTGFESFIRIWILLEKVVQQINIESDNVDKRKYVVPRFDSLKKIKTLTEQDLSALSHLRKVRNQLLHGIEQPSEKFLKEATSSLKRILTELIKAVEDNIKKKSFNDELKQM